MHDDLYHKYPGTVDVKCDSARSVGSAHFESVIVQVAWKKSGQVDT